MGKFKIKVINLWQFIIDLVFPKNCLSCNQEGSYLCNECLNKISLNNKTSCVFCQKDSELNRICEECVNKTALKAVFVVADYNNEILQDLLHNLKYNYIQEISNILIKLINKYIEKFNILNKFQLKTKTSIIVPVPLHKKKYLARGYNQADLIAEKFCLINDFTKHQFIKRIKNTPSQVNLNRQERLNNLSGAFVYNNDKNIDKNKKIIIIDDVLTTGSTLNECANVLASQGFKEIYGLVLAQRNN